jgi:hypothetical protein
MVPATLRIGSRISPHAKFVGILPASFVGRKGGVACAEAWPNRHCLSNRQRCELLTPVDEMARRRIGHLGHDRNRPGSNHMPEGIP